MNRRLYNIKVSHYWGVQPSVLFKSVSDQSQVDIGLKTIYNDKFWMGMDYRNNGDISALLGFYIQDKYMIGYSYDIPNSLTSILILQVPTSLCLELLSVPLLKTK